METLGAGRHADGGGLYLDRDGNGRSRWLFMWTRDGKRREMGLGAASAVGVSLAKAREAAAKAREALANGEDPIEAREAAKREPRLVPTFGEAADDFVKALSPQWRNDKHRAQWGMTLKVYARPLRPLRINRIDTAAVLGVLQPVWLAKPETAARLRGRIERVLDAAKANGHRTGENPARWRGHLDHLLPRRQKLSRGHHAAMPFDDVPGFMTKVREREAVAALALEFLILTAARSGGHLRVGEIAAILDRLAATSAIPKMPRWRSLPWSDAAQLAQRFSSAPPEIGRRVFRRDGPLRDSNPSASDSWHVVTIEDLRAALDADTPGISLEPGRGLLQASAGGGTWWLDTRACFDGSSTRGMADKLSFAPEAWIAGPRLALASEANTEGQAVLQTVAVDLKPKTGLSVAVSPSGARMDGSRIVLPLSMTVDAKVRSMRAVRWNPARRLAAVVVGRDVGRLALMRGSVSEAEAWGDEAGNMAPTVWSAVAEACPSMPADAIAETFQVIASAPPAGGDWIDLLSFAGRLRQAMGSDNRAYGIDLAREARGIAGLGGGQPLGVDRLARALGLRLLARAWGVGSPAALAVHKPGDVPMLFVNSGLVTRGEERGRRWLVAMSVSQLVDAGLSDVPFAGSLDPSSADGIDDFALELIAPSEGLQEFLIANQSANPFEEACQHFGAPGAVVAAQLFRSPGKRLLEPRVLAAAHAAAGAPASGKPAARYARAIA